jgi:hypothetical protein
MIKNPLDLADYCCIQSHSVFLPIYRFRLHLLAIRYIYRSRGLTMLRTALGISKEKEKQREEKKPMIDQT